LFSTRISSQVVSFHPVKVSANQLENFLDIKTNHIKKLLKKQLKVETY